MNRSQTPKRSGTARPSQAPRGPRRVAAAARARRRQCQASSHAATSGEARSPSPRCLEPARCADAETMPSASATTSRSQRCRAPCADCAPDATARPKRRRAVADGCAASSRRTGRPIRPRRERAASGPASSSEAAATAAASGHAAGALMPAHPHAPATMRSTQPDDRDQRRRATSGRDQRRPDLHGLAVVGARQQPRADAGHGAGRQFADDGADKARRDRHLHRGEEEGHAKPASAASRTSAPRWRCRCASGRDASARASAGPSPCRPRPGRSDR